MASLVYDDTPNLKMLLGASLDNSYDETLVASLNGGVVSRYSGQGGGVGIMIIGLWEMFSREVWIDSISLICKCTAPRSDWD